jgi:ABC-type amino acid transport substrate-binding protein
MRVPRGLIAAGLVPVLALAACGGDSGSGSSGGAASTKSSGGGGDVPGLVKSGTLTLATTGNFPPFTMVGASSGKVEGFSVDLGNEIAKRLGLKLTTPTVDFVAELQGLSAGRYDIADSGIWPDPERQKQFLFTPPVASTGFVATTLKQNLGRVKGLPDVKGLRIGAVQGSTREQWAVQNKAKLGYKSLRAYPGASQAVQDLQNGGIDMIVDDPLLAYYYIKQNPGQITTAGKTILAHPLSMAFKNGNTQVQQKVNGVLQKMLDDGTVSQLQKKYWGRCIPTPTDINAKPPYKNLSTGC